MQPPPQLLAHLQQRFDRLQPIGHGAMGAVFSAVERSTGRPVALKIALRPQTPTAHARFRREGELAARLQHPNLVKIHTTGDAAGHPYLVLELVQGARPLDQAWANLPVPQRLELLHQAAQGVAHAHQHGVIHRDLKPDNILVDATGHVCVTDFGIAAGLDLERLTQTGQFVGTPAYMAPEQLGGGHPGPAADVFALGVLLYQALTDHLPHPSDTLLEHMRAITALPPAPSAHRAGLPPGADAVTLQALQPDAAERYPDAAAFAADLKALCAGDAVSAVRRSAARDLVRWTRRHLTWVIAAASILTLVGWQLSALRTRWRLAEQVTANLERPAALLDLAHQLRPLDPDADLTWLPEDARHALRVVAGWSALQSGDLPAAAAALDDAARAPRPYRWALEGALLARDPEADPRRAADLLERAARAWDDSPLDLEPSIARARARFTDPSSSDDERLAAVLERLPGPLSPELTRARVEVLLRLERYDDAASALQSVAVVEPAWRARLALNTARRCLERSDASAALDALTEVEVGPAQARELAAEVHAHLTRTHAERTLEDLVEEVQLLRRLDPSADLPRSLVERALQRSDLLEGSNQAEEVWVSYQLLPIDEVALQIAPNVGRLEGNRRLVLPAVRHALRILPPGSQRTWIRLSQFDLLLQGGNAVEAREVCEVLEDEVRGDPAMRFEFVLSLGGLLRAERDAAGALAAFEEAVELQPYHERARVERARLLLALERAPEALEDMRRLLQYVLTQPVAPAYWVKRASLIVWELSVKLERWDDLRLAAAAMNKHQPGYAGWWARAAWAEANLGGPAVVELIDRGLAIWFDAETPDLQWLAEPLVQARELWSEHPGDARHLIGRVVEALEEARPFGEGEP